VTRIRKARKRILVVGLLVAAIACGSATAATIAAYSVNVHARLAPVAGTTAAGRFSGTLVVSLGGPNQFEPSDNLRQPAQSMLFWNLRLPALHGPMSASLRLRATNGAAPVSDLLCSHCSTAANGSLKLTAEQGLRIAESGGTIVVRTPSAMLRGHITVSPQVPFSQ